MPLVIADRVQETTTSTGTGTITLAGAVTGFQSFAAVGNGNQTYYAIVHTTQNEWEIGIGTYTLSGATLSRTTVLSSTNSGNLVTFSAGTKNVFCTYPAGRSVEKDASNILTLDAGTTTTSPLVFQSGTNLTTATAGAMEYDGKVLYNTPIGTQRGVVPGMQYYRLESGLVGTATNTAQTLFGVGCTLSSSTVYVLEMLMLLTKTATGTSHTISLGFAGTATVNNIMYFSTGINEPGPLPLVETTPNLAVVNTAASTVVTAAYGIANQVQAFVISGTVSINTGGTFIPQYTTSISTGPYTLNAGSYIRMYPIGASGSNTSVGTWA